MSGAMFLKAETVILGNDAIGHCCVDQRLTMFRPRVALLVRSLKVVIVSATGRSCYISPPTVYTNKIPERAKN